jgi:4-hydroxybutyrate CoA-transferase
MRIGVMTCKGCNHTEYDAGLTYKKIKDYFSSDTFISDNDSHEADIWLLVCECSNPCIDHSQLKSPLGKLFIMANKDADKAIYMIEKLKTNFNFN